MPTPDGMAVPGSRALRIGALAKLVSLSPDTLRHYERMGVLPVPRRSLNGYREYPPSTVARVRMVQQALTCGFTLEELARVLGMRDRGNAPCREVRALAARKLATMERELAQLVERREVLRQTLNDWDHRLAHTSRGQQAHLLEHIAVARNPKGHAPRATRSPAIAGRRSALLRHTEAQSEADSGAR